MEALIKSVAEKAGISADQSKSSVQAVIEALSAKMPASLGSQLSGLLSGKELDYTAIAKEVGAEKFNVLKGEASEKFNDLKEEATEKMNEVKDAIKKLF